MRLLDSNQSLVAQVGLESGPLPLGEGQAAGLKAISREKAREAALNSRIAKLERLFSGQWRMFGRLERLWARLVEQRETLWKHQIARSARLRSMIEAVKRLREQIRGLVDFYLMPVFRRLSAIGHRLAGAALGLGRLILAGKNNWRQFELWQSLRVEAGLDPEPFDVFEQA